HRRVGVRHFHHEPAHGVHALARTKQWSIARKLADEPLVLALELLRFAGVRQRRGRDIGDSKKQGQVVGVESRAAITSVHIEDAHDLVRRNNGDSHEGLDVPMDYRERWLRSGAAQRVVYAQTRPLFKHLLNHAARNSKGLDLALRSRPMPR